MNAKKLIAAVAVFTATSSAFASEWVDFSNFKSTKTRAEVVAEIEQANANGQLARNSEFVEFKSTPVASGKTRAEVRAELERAYADGQLATNGSSEFVEFANVASSKTRDQVRQEALAATKGTTAAAGE
ncbi:DUF4148 domain-containing protein [Noviherbaspirillum sp. CPCC 100848]|uniref:DUF4148 domain-containing protein n=1 Tax=Noviherbaspirillum album TaxID=3080276 RepID=A0ABU6JA78_9BURK|nr:DUF4148 domain-containing protein [Noviherbaspirillum sp. CPCC 100848]MEC4720559.1 DUF4148 domain-containing protein [Noviherbaspirillum sp. CPCC 100848]